MPTFVKTYEIKARKYTLRTVLSLHLMRVLYNCLIRLDLLTCLN